MRKNNQRTRKSITQNISETHKKQVMQPLQKLREELKDTFKKEQKEEGGKFTDRKTILINEMKKLVRNESMNIQSFLDFNFHELFQLR